MLLPLYEHEAKKEWMPSTKILDMAKSVGVDTSRYKGKAGVAKITHPSYTPRERY